MDRIELQIPGKMCFLPVATGAARRICKSIKTIESINNNFIDAVELVVSEAATNVVKHLNTQFRNHYLLSFEIYSDRMIISIRDQGPGFDFNKVPPPDFTSVREGGYGLFIIKAKMNEVVYVKNGQWNILSMTKYF